MATAFLSEGKFRRIQEKIGLEDKKKFIEEYKRIGGRFVEGTNEEIEGMYKFSAFFDTKAKAKVKPKSKAKKKK
jgi:hypothetical protein